MGARNRVGMGLSYRPARLHSREELVPLESILGLLKSLKIRVPDKEKKNGPADGMASNVGGTMLFLNSVSDGQCCEFEFCRIRIRITLSVSCFRSFEQNFKSSCSLTMFSLTLTLI